MREIITGETNDKTSEALEKLGQSAAAFIREQMRKTSRNGEFIRSMLVAVDGSKTMESNVDRAGDAFSKSLKDLGVGVK